MEKHTAIFTKELVIPVDDIQLPGIFNLPENATGLVIFSHGSGSGRLSPRNNYVADIINFKGIATLLFDLLTEYEDRIYQNRFNIDLLTERLVSVTKWMLGQEETNNMKVGYFGASTGAASALMAAADLGEQVRAVVSRGGRPDMAQYGLHEVVSPTLLIVGGLDTAVISMNKQAYTQLRCFKELKIVPGATHLFEEPGKLEEVAKLAADWFEKYL